MRKTILGSLMVLTIVAIPWAGEEPWKSKPYQQWDDKDIQRVLTNSPWSHMVTIEATWQTAAPSAIPQPPTGGGAPIPASGGAGGGGGGMGGGARPSGGAPAGGPPTSPEMMARGAEVGFNVYWMSSRMLRAALARRSVLHGGKSEADMEKYVNQPLEDYQIVIQGQDMTPFMGNDELYFQQNSFLQTKKTKQKIAPTHVTYERSPDGKSIAAAIFFFARKTPSGEAAIAPDEKSVQFTCKLGASTLRASFDLQKMVDQKGQDL